MRSSWTVHLRTPLMIVFDLLSLVTALYAGYWIWMLFPWHGHYQLFSEYELILWILPPLGVVVFQYAGLYKSEVGILGVEEQSLVFKGIWILYVLGFAISFFYRDVHFSRIAVFYSVFIAILLISTERYFIRHFFEFLNENGVGVRKAIVYGAGYHGQRLERWIRQSPKLGIRVIGYLDDDFEHLPKKPQTPWLGRLRDLPHLVRSRQIATLFIAHRTLHEAKVVEIFQLCRDLGIQCWAIPSLYHFHVERAKLTNIGGIPLVGFWHGFGWRPYAAVKRLLDMLVAFVLLVLSSPFWAVIGLWIRLASPGPVLFRQIRVGQGGRKFLVYKFRTLKPGPKQDEISPELRKGPSGIIPFGALLRRTGLDELPQLINVLKGEMSLIGPRPEMPFLVEKYGPLERERLTVKPGITGLWQISADRKRLLIHENMDYDLYYVEHMSFNLDLAILMKTLFTVLRRVFEKGEGKSVASSATATPAAA